MPATFILDIDPVILHIAGPIALRWYSLAYILGIFLGAALLFTIDSRSHDKLLSKEALDDLILYSAFGIMIGGRVGYALFYHPSYYLADYAAILRIWEGGMSFHGGCAGLVLSLCYISKKYKISLLKLGDLVACVAPIGLFFGRIANFINGELYGRVTTAPWAVIFPQIDQLPRHPSQIYEAFLEGFLLFFLLILLRFKSKIVTFKGKLAGLFLMLYGIFRFAVENYREPDIQIGFIAQYFTMGQMLSVPFIVVGCLLLIVQRQQAGLPREVLQIKD